MQLVLRRFSLLKLCTYVFLVLPPVAAFLNGIATAPTALQYAGATLH